MPRTRKYTSQAEFIRQQLSSNPNATNAEIIKAGTKAKMKIGDYSIAYVRYSRPSLGEPSVASEIDGTQAIQTAPIDIAAPRENPFADLTQTRAWNRIQHPFEEVRKFCERHGGIERVKTIMEKMEAYDQLQKLIS